MKSTIVRIGAKVLSLGIKVRTIWLAYLAGIFTGWMLCFALVLVIHFAPLVALDLIGQAKAMM